MRRTLIIFVLLSALASGINYLVYPVLARVLPASQFVDVTVALSLFTQITTFLSSTIAITIGLSKVQSKKEVLFEIEFLQSTLFKFFSVIIVLFIAVSPFLTSLIKIPEAFTIPISLMMITAIPIAVISGFLNGRGKLVKLGFVALISAFSQVTIATLGAVITKNGVLTMIFMAISQTITVVVLYVIFKNEGLPKIVNKRSSSTRPASYLRKLVVYTAFSSVAIMAINLLQVEDLLIIKTLNGTEVRFYTDMYLISRIVFFAGSIFIWPFLSEIDLTNKIVSSRALVKLVSFFVLISGGMVAALFLFGDLVTRILFGSIYDARVLALTGLLSIIYKLALLLITAIVLYFTVFRSYIAVALATITSLSLFSYSLMVKSNFTVNQVLAGLDIISLVCAVLAIVMFIRHKPVLKVMD